jgi:hypothetical protein
MKILFVILGGLLALSSTSFAQGLAITPFAPGTTISSTEVNDNFSEIKTAVDELRTEMDSLNASDAINAYSTATSAASQATNIANEISRGYIAINLTSNLNSTCGSNTTGAFSTFPMMIATQDGSYDSSPQVWTVSQTGFYLVSVDAPTQILSGTPLPRIRILLNGSPVKTFETLSFSKPMQFTAGDQIKIEAACFGSAGSGDLNWLANGFSASIRRH